MDKNLTKRTNKEKEESKEGLKDRRREQVGGNAGRWTGRRSKGRKQWNQGKGSILQKPESSEHPCDIRETNISKDH